MNTVKIFGCLTDFQGNPLPGGDIVLLDKSFNEVCMVKTDENGNYQMKVNKGLYMGLIGVQEYSKINLEYWAWNLPAFQDMEINMRNDGLEVYALNAFIPQGASPQIMLYFRPMSLKRFKKLHEANGTTTDGFIAPKLKPDNIEVWVNNDPVEVLYVNSIIEPAGKESMKGYLISVARPKLKKDAFNLIHIVLTDDETEEKGEASLFWQPDHI